jgi:hypothetical protein
LIRIFITWGVTATVEESAVEPLHSADDVAAESAAEPLQSVADSDATADASTETSHS